MIKNATKAPVSRSAIVGAGGPFALDNGSAYLDWRAAILAQSADSGGDKFVEFAGLSSPTPAQIGAVTQRNQRNNMALFRNTEHCGDPESIRRELKDFANAFGLKRLETHRSGDENGIVALKVSRSDSQRGYIPYTNLPIGWHTDGYYNYHGPSRMIRSLILYCAQSSETGGSSQFLDHHIAYIRLRDQNPDFIAALMRPEAMTIPENREPNGTIRPANTGPVFIVDPVDGTLAMRYTRRKRNIVWSDDKLTCAAVRALETVLDNDEHVLELRLAPGEGVVCNNVLHARSGFADGDSRSRLLFRLRSYDSVVRI